MSSAFYDIAQELRKKPGIQLATKGSAGWDRVYVEQVTYDTSKTHPNYPTEATHTFPAIRTPGEPHPKCTYLTLVDAYVSGGDDHKQNWILTYRLDIVAFVKAFPDAAPEGDWQKLLANDGLQTTYPAEDDSPDHIWMFTIVNPDTYVKPAQGTAHPFNASALFINETHQRDGQTLLVTRNYYKVAPASAQQKIGYTLTGEYAGFDILTWSYETPHGDYTVPSVNSACPIPGHQTKRIIKPPDIEIINGLNRRVTITYGMLPGPVIALPAIGEDTKTTATTYQQRRAIGDTFAGAFATLSTIEDNGYSKVWSWTDVKPASISAQHGVGYRVTPEYLGYNIVTWTFDVAVDAYANPISGSACPIPRFASLKVIKPPDLIKSVDGVNLRVTHTYGAIPGPLIAHDSIGDGPGGNITSNTRRVGPEDAFSVSPFLSFQTTEQNGYSKVFNWVTLKARPAHTDYSFDPETRDRISVTRQIVDATSNPTQATGSLVTQQQINPHYSLRTTRSVHGTPTAYEMRAWVEFNIPRIITNIHGQKGDDDQTWSINYTSRGGFSKKLQGRVRVDFHNTQPAAQTIFQIKPSGQVYNGLHFNINVQGSLVDAKVISATTSEYSESVSIAASNPSASQYLAKVGTEVLIREETQRWWSGHIMRTSVFVTLE